MRKATENTTKKTNATETKKTAKTSTKTTTANKKTETSKTSTKKTETAKTEKTSKTETAKKTEKNVIAPIEKKGDMQGIKVNNVRVIELWRHSEKVINIYINRKLYDSTTAHRGIKVRKDKGALGYKVWYKDYKTALTAYNAFKKTAETFDFSKEPKSK